MKTWKTCLSAKRARAEGMERLAPLNTLCCLGAPIPADVGGGSIDPTLKAWPPVTSCLRQSFRGPSGTVFGYRATALHSQLGGREHMSHSFNRAQEAPHGTHQLLLSHSPPPCFWPHAAPANSAHGGTFDRQKVLTGRGGHRDGKTCTPRL